MKEKILAALAEAGAVFIGDSPLLNSFPVEFDDDGEMYFSWTDEDGDHSVTILQEDLELATLEADGFNLLDEEGDTVVLAPYKLQKLW